MVEEIEEILNYMPKITQKVTVSSTLTHDVSTLNEKILIKPKCVQTKKEELQLDVCTQYYRNIKKQKNKFNTLTDLYKNSRIVKVETWRKL